MEALKYTQQILNITDMQAKSIRRRWEMGGSIGIVICMSNSFNT